MGSGATEVLGIKACHRIITDACRERGGEELAEVVAEVSLAIGELYKLWPKGMGAKINVLVTVEYPEKQEHS